MTIGAVGAPVAGANAAVTSSPVAEGKEMRENDHDSDDKAVAASPAKSVNLSGQATGQVIHSVA